MTSSMNPLSTQGPSTLASPTSQPILVTTVDLGDGQSASIAILDGDDPREAAHRFCREHSLPDAIVEPLVLHLLENLEAQERANAIKASRELSQVGFVARSGISRVLFFSFIHFVPFSSLGTRRDSPIY
jgi:hypothetical protein